jgi:hypothetical protein
MEVVLVHWKIRPESDADFRESPYWDSLSARPGFLGEELYQSVEGDQGFISYVRIGRWRRREDFYAALPDVRAGQVPAMEPFEAFPRSREWLSLTLEDTATEMRLPSET